MSPCRIMNAAPDSRSADVRGLRPLLFDSAAAELMR